MGEQDPSGKMVEQGLEHCEHVLTILTSANQYHYEDNEYDNLRD